MKNVLLASVAVAVFALAGCAKEDKMMKDDGMVKEETMMKEDTMAPQDAVMTEEVMVEEAATSEATENPMMDLCFEKGGSIGGWAGADGESTETCDTADGNSYPLASLTSFEAFQ